MSETPAGALEPRLSRWRIAAYALPEFPLAIILFPAYAILPTFYARHTHISLSTIGVVLIASRVFDAVIDPAIGYLSDRTRTPWGARKPWLAVGVVIAMVAVWRLYVPAADVGVAYYAGWLVLFYLGFTLIQIPHKAWGTDIVRNYVDRSAVSAFVGMWFAVGNLVFALVPLLPSYLGHGYDAETLRVIAILVLVSLPLCVTVAGLLAPKGPPVASHRPRIGQLLRSVWTNRPFLQFLSIFVLAGFGQGIYYSLVFLLVSSVQGLGALFPICLLADAIATFVAVPMWYQAIIRIEKHRAWGVGMIVSALSIGAMFWVPAGQTGFSWLLALIVLRALAGAVIYVAPNALLGDVVDFDILKSRTNPAANYHAILALVTKANGAVGGGLGLVLIGLFGFVTVGANTPNAIAGFKLIVLVIPALIVVASGVVAWLFPLDRRRHDIIRRRILSRAKALSQ
jgi:Na+/melibiose symporter-like transporter